jgi:hypothetical protein
MVARDPAPKAAPGGPPSLPRDPRPPALESPVRTFPAVAPQPKDRPKS